MYIIWYNIYIYIYIYEVYIRWYLYVYMDIDLSKNFESTVKPQHDHSQVPVSDHSPLWSDQTSMYRIYPNFGHVFFWFCMYTYMYTSWFHDISPWNGRFRQLPATFPFSYQPITDLSPHLKLKFWLNISRLVELDSMCLGARHLIQLVLWMKKVVSGHPLVNMQNRWNDPWENSLFRLGHVQRLC